MCNIIYSSVLRPCCWWCYGCCCRFCCRFCWCCFCCCCCCFLKMIDDVRSSVSTYRSFDVILRLPKRGITLKIKSVCDWRTHRKTRLKEVYRHKNILTNLRSLFYCTMSVTIWMRNGEWLTFSVSVTLCVCLGGCLYVYLNAKIGYHHAPPDHSEDKILLWCLLFTHICINQISIGHWTYSNFTVVFPEIQKSNVVSYTRCTGLEAKLVIRKKRKKLV